MGNLKNEFALATPLITTRNEQAAHAWTHQQAVARYIEKGEIKQKTKLIGHWVRKNANDAHIFAGDLTG